MASPSQPASLERMVWGGFDALGGLGWFGVVWDALNGLGWFGMVWGGFGWFGML